MEISEICLISLYVSFTDIKGNQANLRNPQKILKISKIKISKFSKILSFFRISNFFIFLKRKLSPLELRKPGLLFFMRISSVILRNVNFEKKVSPRTNPRFDVKDSSELLLFRIRIFFVCQTIFSPEIVLSSVKKTPNDESSERHDSDSPGLGSHGLRLPPHRHPL